MLVAKDMINIFIQARIKEKYNAWKSRPEE
jgi:hypothetical protein